MVAKTPLLESSEMHGAKNRPIQAANDSVFSLDFHILLITGK
jgi:hypothetical protein